MSRVRCTFCDARADSSESLVYRHTKGCPFHSDKQSCKECGRVGVHASRCPMIYGNRRRDADGTSR